MLTMFVAHQSLTLLMRCVRDEQGQARLLLQMSREGYFTNDLLLEQVARTIDVFERVHPYATALFLFDNAPSHRKVPGYALNADRMNVGPGGKQPKMRDTVCGGAVQKLVDECGRHESCVGREGSGYNRHEGQISDRGTKDIY